MKKLLFVAALLVLTVKPVRADSGIVGQLFDNIKSSITAHILDNATPGYFYDFKNHRQLGGVTSELYVYKHLSLDGGLIRSIEAQGHTIPIANLDVHLGSYLAQFDQVKTLVATLGLNGGLLQYAHIGGWAGKDLTTREYLYGLSGGIRVEFK